MVAIYLVERDRFCKGARDLFDQKVIELKKPRSASSPRAGYRLVALSTLRGCVRGLHLVALADQFQHELSTGKANEPIRGGFMLFFLTD